jgi:hypothetical protein
MREEKEWHRLYANCGYFGIVFAVLHFTILQASGEKSCEKSEQLDAINFIWSDRLPRFLDNWEIPMSCSCIREHVQGIIINSINGGSYETQEEI